MKTLLLTLVGVVGMSGLSFGQSLVSNLPEDRPESITITGYEYEPLNGIWTKVWADEGGVGYQNSNGLRWYQWGDMIEVQGNFNHPVYGDTTLMPIDWTADGFIVREERFNVDADNFEITTVSYPLGQFSVDWAGGGFGPGYLPLGETSVFVEQAKDLNIGLVFQDGQWTPAP